jgi:hypothetical protein
MRTLCLDLASVSGFCFGDEAGVQAHGSFELPSTGANYGQFLVHYRRWLFAAIEVWRPEIIVYESPILVKASNVHTLRKLYCMGPRTEEIAQDNAIIAQEANLTDIRNHFIGTPRAPKTVQCERGCRRKMCGKCRSERRRWLKETIITRCRRAGIRPQDDNDADAIALFSYALTQRYRGFVLAGDEIARAA